MQNEIEAKNVDDQVTSSHREERLVVPLPCPVCGLNPERDGECPSWKCPNGSGDPQGIREKGYRFIVRGPEACWMAPWKILPGDLDVTDIEDEEELDRIFRAEKAKALHCLPNAIAMASPPLTTPKS